MTRSDRFPERSEWAIEAFNAILEACDDLRFAAAGFDQAGEEREAGALRSISEEILATMRVAAVAFGLEWRESAGNGGDE